MKKFKIAFSVITKFHFLFIFLLGINVYSQNKNIADSVTNKTSFKDVIYITENNLLTAKSAEIIANFRKTVSEATEDREAPVLTCPVDQKLASGSLVPSYFEMLTVTDNMDSKIDVTQNPGAGSTFYDGMEIKFTATDDAGNTSKSSIFITAISRDITPPTFTCPTGVTLNCGDKIPNYATNLMMNLKDDYSNVLSYIMTPAPGTEFYNDIPVQIEYFDSTGNKSVCSFTISMSTPEIAMTTAQAARPEITSYLDKQNLRFSTAGLERVNKRKK
jgi:large repetitive protein